MAKTAVTTEGNFTAKVICADVIEHRFKPEDPDAFEVRIKFETDTAAGAVYLPITDGYIAKGKHAGAREMDISFNDLAALGVSEGGRNLGGLDVLKGKTIQVYAKRNDKGTMTCYLSSAREDKPLDVAAAAARLARLTGAAPRAQPAAAQKAAASLEESGEIPF
jgi:hypothetical protein